MTTITTLTLSNRHMQCDISPALGGCVAGLWRSGIPVLRSTPGRELQSVRQCASYPLVPYSNRIAFAQLQWQGTDHALPPNFAPEPHAIHGVGWERPWQTEQSDGHSAVLRLEHRADASWPFDWCARQTITLQEDALLLHMEITNTGSSPAPAGLGWHPYFAKHTPDRLDFAATGRWEMDADKLPTERLAHPGLQQDCANLSVDHCFDGWSGSVRLHNRQFSISITSDLSCLVVFTTPVRDNIAIEPVSHVNNALNLLAQGMGTADALGVRILQPGQTFAAHMRIGVQGA